MQSFSSLNSFANQSLTVTDLRGSRVVFDRVRPSGVSLEVTSSTVTVNSYGTQIQEIINFSTANVRFKIELKKAVGSAMSASVAFGGLPSGVTLTTTSTTWTLTGLKSKADWDAVKTTVWTLNASFASFPQWYFEYRITYYDSDLGQDVNVTWDVFDPDFYPISFVSSAATLTCRGDVVVASGVKAKTLSHAFTVTTAANLSGVLATSTLSSQFTATCIGADLRLVAMATTLNFVLASNIVFSKQARAQAALTTVVTLQGTLRPIVRLISQANFVANFIGGSPFGGGTSGPGGVPYLEGNGFAYYNIDGSLFNIGGMPPGLTRIRPGAAALSSSFTTTCIGADARLMSSMIMSAGTMTTTGRRLAGLTLNANVITTQTATANFVSRSTIVNAPLVTGLVGSIVGPVRTSADITASATMNATAFRIKQAAGAFSSAVTTSFAVNRKANLGSNFVAAASMSVEGFLNNPMVVHYTITNTTLSSGAVRTVYLPLGGTVACQVQWGDGTIEEFTTPGIKTHQYATIGSKIIKIFRLQPTGIALETYGAIPYADRGDNLGFSVGDNDWWAPANLNWNEGISTFGSLGVTKIPQALLKGLGGQVSNVPTTLASSITDLQYANIPNSSNCVGWNTVNVTTAQKAFATDFNQAIGTWNVSGLTNARIMFQGCSDFNQSLNLWNVSNVTNMSNMFASCRAFNQNLNSWNVSNVTDMGAMFFGCYAFNGTITSWNTANVTTMGAMFYDNRAFNQPIGVWNTGSVTSMATMFSLARVFNQPLNGWNVSNVTTMLSMFSGARVFNQPLNSWNTAKVTNMDYMFNFNAATAFDQDISSWPVPLIPSKPIDFDTGTLATWTTAEKPNWGV
jgi:surface protein